MSHAHIVLNELSLECALGAPRRSSVDLLMDLIRAIQSLRRNVAQHDEERIVPVVPDALGSKTFPDGTTVLKALNAVDAQDQVAAAFLRRILSAGPWFDDQGIVNSVVVTSDRVDVRIFGKLGAGLRAALDLDGLTMSFHQAPWSATPLQATVTTDDGSSRMEVLENLWTTVLTLSQLGAIEKHVAVLPEYENPGHHEPDGPHYIQGKSHIPREAERLLRYSLPADAARTRWWARCEHDFFHRFQGSLRGQRIRVHWNGTTNPKATDTTSEAVVPIDIRNQLRGMEPARSCGCRELK